MKRPLCHWPRGTCLCSRQQATKLRGLRCILRGIHGLYQAFRMIMYHISLFSITNVWATLMGYMVEGVQPRASRELT